MRKFDADVKPTDNEREAVKETSECASTEEVNRAADRALQRNREALTELADW